MMLRLFSEQCPVCKGAGRVWRMVRAIEGRVEKFIVCQRCHGCGAIRVEDTQKSEVA